MCIRDRRICWFLTLIFTLIWCFITVLPVTSNTTLTPEEALTLIVIDPFFFLALGFFIVTAIIRWSEAIKSIEPEFVKKGLMLSPLAFFVTIILGILFIMLVPGGWFFDDFATGISSVTGSNPVLTYLFGSGYYIQNCITPLTLPMIITVSPGVGAIYGWETIPSILAWTITGLILIFITKKWKISLWSGIFSVFFVWIFVIIATRITLMPASVLNAADYAFLVCLMLISAMVSAIPMAAGVLIGNEIYKLFHPVKKAPGEIPSEGDLIECRNSKNKLEGYIDGKQYLDQKKNLCGFLDGNVAKDKNGIPLLILRDDGVITYSEELKSEEQGYIKDGKIYHLDGSLIYEFIKEKRQILDSKGEVKLRLEGSIRLIEKLEDVDFFGIATIILELFS